ncbi:MAG: type I restriction-modification enzyme R subunit C-terminal domain-containing protein, partial [Mariprofundaceae bacterium]|nr:type I restriction-modification enzyme R subunit C-terminal domain-containing protein [Mariprofundaceae bacterium]
PISREERVSSHEDRIFERYADNQQQFLSFVLEHYVTQGVEELDQEKLPDLLELKYHSMGDAVRELGSVGDIRDVFIGFQKYLYERSGLEG